MNPGPNTAPTHLLRVPAPVSALSTWCGLALADVPAGDSVTGVAAVVDCERCRDAMRAALVMLRAWEQGEGEATT